MDNQALTKVISDLRTQRAAITHAIDVLAPVVDQAQAPTTNLRVMPRKKFQQTPEARARIRRATLRRWQQARKQGRTTLAA